MSTEIIVLILQFIPLQTLLTRVNRVCWKLHDIIENSPILWKDINFDYHICISCDDLRRLLIYSRIAQSIHLPHSTCEISSPDIDSVLTSSKFDSLIWLDLSQAPVSTLCFLYNAPNIKLVNLSECQCLQDSDFVALKKCEQLEQLYVSFTRVTGQTLEDICIEKPLCVIDACEISLNVQQCRNILMKTTGDVLQFSVSLHDSVDLADFNENVVNCFVNTSVRVFEH